MLAQYLNTCKKNDGLNKTINWNFFSKAVNAIFRNKRNLNNKCNSLKNNSCIDVIIRNGIAHVWEKVTEFHHTKIRIVIRVTWQKERVAQTCNSSISRQNLCSHNYKIHPSNDKNIRERNTQTYSLLVKVVSVSFFNLHVITRKNSFETRGKIWF